MYMQFAHKPVYFSAKTHAQYNVLDVVQSGLKIEMSISLLGRYSDTQRKGITEDLPWNKWLCLQINV